MISTYNPLRNAIIIGSLGIIALTGGFTLINYIHKTKPATPQVTQEQQAKLKTYSFNDFGVYPIQFCYNNRITAGDFDGDGAIDIAIINDNNFTILRNEIPQVRKEGKLEKDVKGE